LPFCVDKEKENLAKPYRGLPKDSGNFGWNSNGKVRFGFFRPEYSGSPLSWVPEDIFFLSILLVRGEAGLTTGRPSSLYESHKEHNMASNYKGLYGIFYKISMKVVESENIQ